MVKIKYFTLDFKNWGSAPPLKYTPSAQGQNFPILFQFFPKLLIHSYIFFAKYFKNFLKNCQFCSKFSQISQISFIKLIKNFPIFFQVFFKIYQNFF
jgi:hypothetical protein